MGNTCQCGNPSEEKKTLKSVMSSYLKSMKKWSEQGFPVVDNNTHQSRINVCNACVHKRKFVCSYCNCIIYIKTKLASEQCPLKDPKWKSI